MAHERRSFRVGADHDPRRVAQEQDGERERLTELQEPRRLVRSVAGDRPCEVHGVVGDDADGMPLDTRQRGDHSPRKERAQLEQRTRVDDDVDGAVHVVGAPPVLWYDVSQHLLIGCLPRGNPSLEKGQRVTREPNRVRLVGGGDIDDTVAHLHVERPDLVGVHDAEPAALDHRRATHADAGIGGCDDHVAATEQRRVAGEAATGRDADARHHPGKTRPQRERHDVEAGHHRVLGVAGPAAATFGEEHDGQPHAFDHLEEPVLLAVAHHALRSREHRVVVGEHRAARAFPADERRVHAGGSGDEPVGRGAADEIVDSAPPTLRGDGEGAVLDEAAVIAEVGEVLARGPSPRAVTSGDHIGANSRHA